VSTIPLLSHGSPGAVVAYRKGVAITAQQFVADAVHLADSLPAGKHVLNVCFDRYQFTVGLAACLISGRVSLLPSTHTPEVIRRLAQFAPDAFCLTDEVDCSIELPRFPYPRKLRGPAISWQVPQIPATQTAAIVFTSGSTGTPLPYPKTWGKLARCVRDGAPRLGLLDGRRHTLIGTVPAQHMYGFESTVLLALLSGNAFSSERPFYPADISAAVSAVPQPRTLVSTPIHLRTLLAAGTALPPVDLIVSATAPLPLELAHEVETTFRAPLLEIYGSTETGQIATRRTAMGASWHLWPEVRLTARDDQVFAQGGHVEQMTAMCDVIEITSDTEFLLHGRTADLVNVAGKRSSFGYLNTQLHAIPGVVDGAFFLRDAHAAAGTGVARLAAAVVAPSLSVAQLTEHLRQRIDPVFLPRPLLMVDQLPRNATGKLPQQALLALAGRHVNASTQPAHSSLRIAADHAAYAGHFPGFPILPGAALLDEALHEIELSRGIDLARWQVASAKFLGPVRPGDDLTLEHSVSGNATIRFVIRSPNGAVASGTLAAVAAIGDEPRGA
jgi:acyl-CoA synthetase (AMP-forming)/AMP-acid ligase II